MKAPAFIDADTLGRVPVAVVIDALAQALVAGAGVDPEADPARMNVAVPDGQLLVMPSSSAVATGVKLVVVAPGHPARGLPRVQGLYVLFDADTLAPAALLDGAALTLLRTSAVSALALRHLAVSEARRLVVFGTGPQALAHVVAVHAVRPIEHVAVAGRDADRQAAFLSRVRARGLGLEAEPLGAGGLEAADVICCCTGARAPLFDGRRVSSHAAVVAIGSHEPDARELDAALLGRASVVVEARGAALREAGDVLMAIGEGGLDEGALVGLAPLVRGEVVLRADRPRVFKSVGMAWEDAVVAAAVVGGRR